MQALQSLIFPIDSRPFGFTYGEWSARWWQWVLRIPKQDNPLLDITGTNTNIEQKYPDVFFLCQTYEEVDSIPHRTIKIESGRCIFMPIINWISIADHDGRNKRELFNTAKNRMDVIKDLEIIINGLTIKEGLHNLRAQSPFFDVVLPEENVAELPPGQKTAISDGYWLFVKGFNNDTKLSTLASCSSGATTIGVNYNIFVM